jgi:hypothetical protein
MRGGSKRAATYFVVCAALACVTAGAGAAERSDFKRKEAALIELSAAQTTQEVFITDVELARDDGTGRAGQRVTGFRAKDNPLHCIASLNKPRAGVRVRFVWVAVDAGGERERVIADAEYVTRPGEARADGAASLPREWPKGRYRVQVVLNGRLARTLDFQII